ncbi:MAG: hypothetical protein NVSMB23_03810 [Myxococcales bacterium]
MKRREPAGARALSAAARGADAVRWAFLPLALCALLAVGAHAAADVLCDRLLFAIDGASSALDELFSRWSVTQPLVDLVGLPQRSLLARGLAFALELWADALLALPLLAYEERAGEGQRALALLRKLWTRPSTLRIARPIFTAAVAVAGSCAVARLLRASIFAAARGVAGPGAAGGLARLAGLAALAAVLALIAGRAVVQGLVHADARAGRTGGGRRRALTAGLAGTALLAPVAWAAAAHAAPLLSFLR